MIMTVLTFFYTLASIRTNLIIFIIILFIDLAFFMLMSNYWVLAEGKIAMARNLQIVRNVCFRFPPCQGIFGELSKFLDLD